MIPKVIHYCWFGRKPLPKSALKCINSWRKFFPDYEIKEWNEDNFDVNIIPYTAEAYKAKKYAFVSDYARFWILYRYGGLYFDTDVEVIKSMDDIIERGAFMGIEVEPQNNTMPIVAPGLGLGATSGLLIYKLVLDYYKPLHFVNSDGSYNYYGIVPITTNLLIKQGLNSKNEIQNVSGINIYPKEFFNPYDYTIGNLCITTNTRSIHWYSNTWASRLSQLKLRIGVYFRKIISLIK